MSTRHRELLLLGISRLVNLSQKRRQQERAKKVQAYLKMCKAVNSNVFKTKLRIDSNALFELLGMIRPYIEAQDTDLEPASVEERLLVTIRYLVTGCTPEQLSPGSGLSTISVKRVIQDTCKAIFKCLNGYIKLPKTEKEWTDIALQFEKKWNFSHCVGSLVAKHIPIEKPTEDPDNCLNHKGFHSIAFVVVVNADHEFIFTEVGFGGGGQYIYESSKFFDRLVSSWLELPQDCPLEGENTPVPYVFVGETHFLIENIMTPYRKDRLTSEEKIFNYRFARAKRVADNTLGVLYEKFGVFRKCISEESGDLNSVLLACFALHNYLKRTCEGYICPESLDSEDLENFTFTPGSWRLKKADYNVWSDTHPFVSLSQGPETECDPRGGPVREQFTQYFNNEGKEHFQYQMVNVVPV